MKLPIFFHRRGAEFAQRRAEKVCENSLRISANPLRLCGELLFILFALTFAACREAEIKPVNIAAEDVCTHCKMALSEKQFAAEFITSDGEAVKFDDIGCLLDYRKEKPDTKIATPSVDHS